MKPTALQENTTVAESNKKKSVAPKDTVQFSSSDSEESLDKNISAQAQNRFNKAKKLNRIVRKSRIQKEKDAKQQKEELVSGAKNLGNYKKLYLARKIKAKDWIYKIVNFLTLGMLSVANFWTKSQIEEKFKFQKVKDLEKSNHIVVIDSTGKKRFIRIQNKTLTLKEEFELETFVFILDRKLFYWDYQQNKFESAEEFRERMTVKELVSQGERGLPQKIIQNLQETFGTNCMVIMSTSLLQRCRNVLSTPFASF